MKTTKTLILSSMMILLGAPVWAQRRQDARLTPFDGADTPPPPGRVAQTSRARRKGRPWLGVSLARLTRASRSRYKVPFRYGGVLVTSVTRGSPAMKAGMRKNDVIVRLDGKYVYKPQDVIRHILTRRPGQRMKADVYRWGSWKPLKVVLGNKQRGRHRGRHRGHRPPKGDFKPPFKSPPHSKSRPHQSRRPPPSRARRKFVRKLIQEVRSLRREVNQLKKQVKRLQKKVGVTPKSHGGNSHGGNNDGSRGAPATVPPPAPSH